MKFPQLLTIVGLLCLGGLLSQVRDAVEPQAVASSKTAVVKTSLDSLDCDCGPDCKCHSETKSQLADLQAKYDAMLAEKTKTASFKASTGNGSSGGSTGKTAQVSIASNGYFGPSVNSTGGGGSTGRHPVANTVNGAALVTGKTVETAAKVVKGTVNVAAKVATAPVANYRARWTYPGTIEQHMATSHGVSVSGMSQSDLLAQHDAIHDTIGTTYSTSTQTSYSSSSCPGGVCPSSRTATASRPGLLGRIFRR